MKRIFILCIMVLVLTVAIAIAAAVAASVSGNSADLAAHKSCMYCGMDREKFAHSRMLIEFDDGSVVPTCSLHCAAVGLANNIDKTPRAIKVSDFGSRELIDAEKAVWIIGGSKQGVMTRNAKWAFAVKEKADAFIKDSGGKLASFDEAIKAAYEDMYSDTRMIRDKRRQMKMKQGGQGKSN